MTARVVILCAGASSRLGEPKALASIGGRAVLDWMLTRALHAFPGAAAPIVVTGAHHAEIGAFLMEGAARPSNPLPSEIARNADWSKGRTAGLQLVARMCRGTDLLIWPADVPLVSARTLRTLVHEWGRIGEPSQGWLAPEVGRSFHAADGSTTGAESSERTERRFGHPILLGARLLECVHELAPDGPLRQLREQAAPLAAVTVDDLAVLDDLDTPKDLERLRRRVRAQGA